MSEGQNTSRDAGVEGGPPQTRCFHQIGVVRAREGLSRRAVARRLGIDVEQVKRDECPTCDLPLSRVYDYAQAIGVPVIELLVDADDDLAIAVKERAQFVRLAKMVQSILEQAKDQRTTRLAQTMLEQLVEMMPELKEVTPYHTVGRRRTQDELGRAAYQAIGLTLGGDE